MSLQRALAVAACALTSACGQGDGPPLGVSSIVVPEPLPGASMTAGYLTLDNDSNAPVIIRSVTSPQFARVEMHETILQDDVARMVALAPLTIEGHSSMRFEPGGKHLMLLDWSQDIVAGLQVTLEFHYDDGGLLIVTTTVSPRDELQD